MAGRPLFRRYPLGLQTTYSELKQRAFEQRALLLGTLGSVSERVESGRRYLFRQFYDAESKKAAEYIGPSDDAASAARADEIRARIDDAGALAKETQLLTRVGYVDVDARTQAVLVVLTNAGVFRGGALLIGSQAYGAILNDLGVGVATFATEDVDIARPARLAVAGDVPSFEALLQQSRVPLSAIPGFDPREPSTSFSIPPRMAGKRRLRVDLIAPAPKSGAALVAVPELKAHAVSLPHLRYLLEDPVETVVLGKASVIPVRVPRPERLAWHKMLVSQLRSATSDKRAKDISQAAVLIAVLAEDAPDTLVAAWAKLPKGSRAEAKGATPMLRAVLAAGGHERALGLLEDAVAGRDRGFET